MELVVEGDLHFVLEVLWRWDGVVGLGRGWKGCGVEKHALLHCGVGAKRVGLPLQGRHALLQCGAGAKRLLQCGVGAKRVGLPLQGRHALVHCGVGVGAET